MPIVEPLIKNLKPRPCSVCGQEIGTADYTLPDGRHRVCIPCGDAELARLAGLPVAEVTEIREGYGEPRNREG